MRRLAAEWRASGSPLLQLLFALGVAAFALAFAAGLIESQRQWGHPPGYGIDYGRLGDWFGMQHDWTHAATEYEATERINRDDPVSAQKLVGTLDALGDGPGALAALETAGRRFPYHVAIQQMLVERLAAAGRPAEALRAAERLAEVTPGSFLVQLNRGNLLMQLKRYADAVPVFEQAVLLDPASVQAHFGLGAALEGNGEHAAARAALEETLALDPTSANAHLVLGIAHMNEQHYEAAQAAFEQTLVLEPNDPTATRYLAEVKAYLAEGGGS